MRVVDFLAADHMVCLHNVSLLSNCHCVYQFAVDGYFAEIIIRGNCGFIDGMGWF